MKKVFIGGLGRSGTTITLSAFSFHPALYAIPIETKFLVEADGFYDLMEAVTTNYSTASTTIAVSRFEDLMRNQVTGLKPSSFTQQDCLSPSIFDNYHKSVDALMEVVRHRKFHPSREPLLIAMRTFLKSTFDRIATVSDKKGWAEKTPANYWRTDFLQELCPGSHFVHCLRDPRKIMASLMQKGWIETDPLEGALHFESMLAALTIKRRTLMQSPRVHEIRLEQLESETTITQTLNRLAKFLDLEPFSHFAVESVAEKIAIYHRKKTEKRESVQFSTKDSILINQMLLPWVLELGYPAQFPEELMLPEEEEVISPVAVEQTVVAETASPATAAPQPVNKRAATTPRSKKADSIK